MLDYINALKSIKKEELRGSNPVPDLLSFLHIDILYGKNLETILNNYLGAIIQNQRNVKPLLKIDVPKSNFTIRPMSRPPLKEWLIYESIIKYLSNEILLNHPDICSRSFSILKFKEDIKRTTDPWLRFDEKARELYHKGYRYVVITDITGYYENINLEQLRNRLLDFISQDSTSNDYIKALFNMLRKWSSERIKNFGLPQGPPASSFLGDIFLDHVDRKMEKYEGYFRYMDDIKIFCKNEIEARIALKDLIIALRKLKLNINAKKTDILHGENIEKKLFDPHNELMTLTDNILNSGDIPKIKKFVVSSLQKLFEESFTEDPFERRHLNFSLYRLDILYNSGIEFDHNKIINTIIENIDKKPHHSGIFCNFLSNFIDDKMLWEKLLSFLRSEKNIYEWQELKILQCLLKANVKLTKPYRDFLFGLCQDRNKHHIVGCFYILLFGKHGTNRERDLIIDMYHETDSEYKKMAVLLAVQELGKASRSEFYNRIKSTDNEDIARFVDYIKSLQNPLYYLQVDKPKIETYEELLPEEY